MPSLYRTLATSSHPLPRAVRAVRRAVLHASLPAPRVVVVPLLWTFVAVRSVYYFMARVFVAEPLFKAYCTKYGRGFRTGVFVHFVTGRGRIIIGDGVTIDGKCEFLFAARFSDAPTIEIGDGTGINHGCTFTVARRITIGRNCRLAGAVAMFDSHGHPADPVRRLAGEPPDEDDIRPITIEDNVWIGGRVLIFPGVTIGEGSIVSAGSVVTANVPPYSVVAGNPARKVRSLDQPSAAPPATLAGV